MSYLLHQAVTRAAELTPQQEALRCNGQSLSYAELARRAGSLARLLLEHGVQRGDRVGIYLPKSLESHVAVYGIMLAGAAYVPLDPLAPVARTSYVIGDCGIHWLATSEEKRANLPAILEAQPELACLLGVEPGDDLAAPAIPWDQVWAGPAELPDLGLTEMDLAYILYTSGSTGDPKGIMHTHRSGLAFAQWAATTYGLRADDRLSNHAPLHFDLSTLDLFAGALAGATTVIIPEAITKFPASVAKLMVDERISVWYSVPFALIQLLQRGNLAARDLSALRWVLFAGEVFPTKHLRSLMAALPGPRYSNLYGPTETNVCTYFHVDALPEDTDETIPIGVVCENAQGLVVDADGQPLPAGQVGELVIRGPIVMRGYWGRPDMSERGFLRHAVFPHYRDIFYRTGDLVQQRPDGNLIYLGRKDRQIKTRGYRVELDEVEVALLAHGQVEEAAVFPVPDGDGSNLIVAAVIAKAGCQLSSDLLVGHLSSRLPWYAVPATIDLTDDFPRTSTGKIDRRALRERALAPAA